MKSVGATAPGNTLNSKQNSAGEWLPDVKYVTGLTPDDLKHIMAFRHLKTASLAWHPIDDEGVHQLCQLDSLQYLGLAKTKVTDNATVHLNRLKQLRTLDLQETLVSETAIDRLGELLPNCEILK